MLSALYRLLLTLHPASFRDEFGGEMQLIFEETASTPARACQLLADCTVSLLRQWLIGYQAWKLIMGLSYWFAFFVLLIGLLAHRGLAAPR